MFLGGKALGTIGGGASAGAMPMKWLLGGLLGGSILAPSLCVGGDVFPSLSKL
jgi:hypothetical protein